MMKKHLLETFVPLYISNYCDSDCMMCNMRKSNTKLVRIEANDGKILEQLRIIYNVEKISAVCFLCGEYFEKNERIRYMHKIIYCIENAIKIGYEKVFFNIGALFDDEIDMCYKKFKGNSKVVLSLFQETYDRKVYHLYFGKNIKSIPKAYFDLRYSTPKRWLDVGFESIDIGILLGLHNPNLDIDKLIEHAYQLSKDRRKVEVYISLPRIRGIERVPYNVDDDEYRRIIKKVRSEYPNGKIVITTRETGEFIRSVLDYIDVVSPGSSDVTPYTLDGEIENNILTSQFVVSEKRERPSDFLRQLNQDFVFLRNYIGEDNNNYFEFDGG